MAGWTNKGKYEALGLFARNMTRATNYYVVLYTSASASIAAVYAG